jgi:hypothetical protein
VRVNVGLIGAGFVAEIHAQAYREVPGLEVRLLAVTARTAESASAFAARHGIPDAYDDYRRILDREDIDLVDVCTPNVLHEPIVVAAAQAGKHVACEKPLTGYFGGPGASAPVGALCQDVGRGGRRLVDAPGAASHRRGALSQGAGGPVARREADPRCIRHRRGRVPEAGALV